MEVNDYTNLQRIKSENAHNFTRDHQIVVHRRRSSANFFHNSFNSPKHEIEHEETSSKSPVDSQNSSNKKDIILKKIEKTKAILWLLENSLKKNDEIIRFIQSHNKSLVVRQNSIEDNIQRIKKLMKSKQKKHVKYNQFLPLCRIYNYSVKRIYRYYQLFEVVNNSTSVSLRSPIDTRIQTPYNKQTNRYKFTAVEDKYLLADWKDIDWRTLAKEHLKRDVIECFTRKLELTGFYQYKKWSPSEDLILKKAILYYGPKNWQQISYCLEGRNNSQCFHRWMKGINPKIKRTKWTLEEDLTLGIALKIYGSNKWAKISMHISNRTDIQCRERYCNILDPKLTDIKWTLDEDLKLCSLQSQYGNKWSTIAKKFGDRTDNTCWRRFKYLKFVNSSMQGSIKGKVEAENSLNYTLSLKMDNDCEEEEDYDNYIGDDVIEEDDDDYMSHDSVLDDEQSIISCSKKRKAPTVSLSPKIFLIQKKKHDPKSKQIKVEPKSALLSVKRNKSKSLTNYSTKPDEKVRIFLIKKHK